MQPGFHAAYLIGLVIAVAIQQPVDQNVASPVLHSGHDLTARFVGSDACVQCHKDGHDFAAYAVTGKEYSVWANRDPHSTAYADLFSEQSKAIARNLRLDTPPHKADLCLNCHATNPSKQQLALCSKHTVTDGVGCESCHGPAEKWLVPHRLPDWKYWSPSQKSSLGFIDTDNVATRARNCAECHVGSEGRDVNHDLIAAGHPRLFFEMSAYQSKMPRHWSRANDLVQNSATETRLWLVGQYVGAAASLELLKQRINNANSPWPEFSEYNCASCHHNLAERREKNDGFFATAASKPSWGTWHFSMLEQLSKTTTDLGSVDFSLDIEMLRDEMQAQMPAKDVISPMADRIREQCDQMADYLSTATLSGQEAVGLIAPQSEPQPFNWEVLTQRYLAAVAIRQSLKDLQRMDGRFSASEFEKSKIPLLEIRETLKFIENYDQPKGLDAEQRSRIEQNFGEIFQSIQDVWKYGSPVILNRGTR